MSQAFVLAFHWEGAEDTQRQQWKSLQIVIHKKNKENEKGSSDVRANSNYANCPPLYSLCFGVYIDYVNTDIE